MTIFRTDLRNRYGIPIRSLYKQTLNCSSRDPIEMVRMQHSTRILVVDDHALFRESLVRLLESEPDLQVIAHCESIAAARDILSRTAVDMVLLDYDLGEESGATLIRDLQSHSVRPRVLVVTASTSDVATVEILKAGAAGVFFKHRQPAQLLEAIRKISQGELWLDSDVLRSLIAATRARAQRNLVRNH